MVRNQPTMTTRPIHDRALTDAAERGPDFVEALDRGLRVLGAFERDAALSNGELAKFTGLPKATVSRLTGTLIALGYLYRDEDTHKYVIGSRMLGLGANVQRHMHLQRAARPRLQEFADTHDITVALGTRDGNDVLLLEMARPPRSQLTINSDIGSHVPLANSSIGMACLVATPVRERVRLLEDLLRRHPQDWSGMRQRVERAHAEREQQGFIAWLPSRGGSIAATAVPLIVERRRTFGFSAAAPRIELPHARLLEVVGPALADMVDRIAHDLGGLGATPSSPARVSPRAAA